MDKIQVLYFLEDRAHEGFIKALVERIANELSIRPSSLIHDIRSARGGSRVINQVKKFLKEVQKMSTPQFSVLIIAIHGNCKRHAERVRDLEKTIKKSYPARDRIVYAVPDPHIERWYIMDQRAFKNGVGLNRAPDLPAYKCKRDHYKQVINQALKDSDVNSLLSAAEYGESIVNNIGNLNSLGSQNAGFRTFVEDLRRALRL